MEQSQLSTLRREIAAIEGRPVGFAEEGLAGFSQGSLANRSPEGRNSDQATSALEPVFASADARPTPRSDGSERAENGKRLSLGVPRLDERLNGGLPLAALHEVRCTETRESGALTGFAAALLIRLAAIQSKPILWIEEETSLAEAGLLFGGGLARFGLDPNRLIVIRTRRTEDALWTLEEGLRCVGLAAVLAVIRASPQALDLTTSRRLALRAAKHGVMGLLLRQASEAEAGAATTRWRISSRPAGAMDGFTEGVGRPAWQADLEKNRLGPIGRFDLEWDHAEKCFIEPAAANLVTRTPVPIDRPDRPTGTRPELALKKAG